jgi:ATP-dependent RNA helicase RhlB
LLNRIKNRIKKVLGSGEVPPRGKPVKKQQKPRPHDAEIRSQKKQLQKPQKPQKQQKQSRPEDNRQRKHNENQRRRKKPSQSKPIPSSRSLPKPHTFEKQIPKRPETLVEIPPEDDKMRFADLNLHEDILFGLQDMEFKYCTPIQQASLPELLNNRDLTGKAQTGTGKTAAFLLAAYQKMMTNPPSPNRKPGTCRMLVLAPTRELAIQIHKDAEDIGKYLPFYNMVVFGGMDHQKQREHLARPVDILIGTPGRLIDYSRSRHLDLSKTEVLVIDEADRMLDMGFIPDVRRIIGQCPRTGNRQTILFSATLDESIHRLADGWLQDPVTVESEPEQVVTDLIDQTFYTAARHEKFPLLMWLLKNEEFSRIMIFGNRKDFNGDLCDKLRACGIDCGLLSGDVPQQKRIKILDRFRSGEVKILVATDVAARGIHIDDVSHVINYDLPERAEDYVHRIGRTGRAGTTGKSISFVCEMGAYALADIEKYADTKAECIFPEDEMVAPIDVPYIPRKSKSGGGRSGGPRSGRRNDRRPGNRRSY